MKIENKPMMGGATELNKWYFGIEILKCPPSMFRVFKPFIFIWWFKIIEEGELWKIGGKAGKKKGGWWHWTSPKGISIEII